MSPYQPPPGLYGDDAPHNPYVKELNRAEARIAECEKEIKYLELEVAELGGALKFYADPEFYEETNPWGYFAGLPPVMHDGGDFARRSLWRDA